MIEIVGMDLNPDNNDIQSADYSNIDSAKNTNKGTLSPKEDNDFYEDTFF